MTRQSRIWEIERWTWAFWSWPNSHTHTHTLLQHHILGKHFGTRRCHIDLSASTEFDLLVNYFPQTRHRNISVFEDPDRPLLVQTRSNHGASTEFDLWSFSPNKILTVHVYSFPRRTISLCSKTPPTHSLFKLDLIMARATTEVGTEPRELWSAFWASWRWNIFDSWFFFYKLKMEWIMNFCQFCPCSFHTDW